jgi:hypothetical protein
MSLRDAQQQNNCPDIIVRFLSGLFAMPIQSHRDARMGPFVHSLELTTNLLLSTDEAL